MDKQSMDEYMNQLKKLRDRYVDTAITAAENGMTKQAIYNLGKARAAEIAHAHFLDIVKLQK